MQVIFVPGGYLNELGPFEPGARITIPHDWAPQLLADGIVKPLPTPGVGAAPIKIGFSISVNSDDRNDD